MKVSTDGTLLGAWAKGGDKVLDVGTGTGLIALMMAQRFPNAQVVGIDIDEPACLQARENVVASPFHQRVDILHVSLQEFEGRMFDAVVCNPPFFVDSLQCPDDQRTTARHAGNLSYAELFEGVVRLLDERGEFSAIIPTECRTAFDAEAILAGLSPVRECAVMTTERKAPRRYLLGYRKTPVMMYERHVLIMGSEEYREMMKDFYLNP